MKVFVSKSRWFYAHFDKDCLARSMKEQGHSEDEISEIDVDGTTRYRFCSHCCPAELQTPKVIRTRCSICRQPMPQPCRHNGGVLVRSPYGTKGAYTTRWRWPENVRGATLALLPQES